MTKWTSSYTDEQRAAIVYAFCDLRIRPVAQIHRMAEAGELAAGPGGERVAAFAIPYSTLMQIGQRAERRKRGEALPQDLARKPPRDQAEYLQRRLVAVVDHELTRIETAQAKSGSFTLDPRHARDMARLLKEIATLPDPAEKRLPPVPGQRDQDGAKPDNATRSGLGASILAASDKSMSPSTRADTLKSTETEREDQSQRSSAARSGHDHDDDHENHDGQRATCSPSSEDVSRASGDVAGVAVLAG